MQRRSPLSRTLAAAGVLPALWVTGPVQARPAIPDGSNIPPSHTPSVIAPALPLPPVPSADPPSAFLVAARRAVARGRTGEAQEALERAETRLLDRDLPPTAAPMADNRQAVLAIAAARRAVAARDRPAATAAIDDAVAAINRPSLAGAAATPASSVSPAAPEVPPSPPQPVITRALLPGHWALHGARYVWIAPETTPRQVQSAGLVPGAYVWRQGAYRWVPTHVAN